MGGVRAAMENGVHHPETKNPACFAASRVLENFDSKSVRELPARLLDGVLVCETRVRIGGVYTEAKYGLLDTPAHTRATQPSGRLRLDWICT